MNALQPLSVTLVQGATRWHDAEANREYYGALVRGHAAATDLFVLPETFLSGFSNDTRASAETMDGPGVAWLRALAGEVGSTITGSLAIREGGTVYNRLLWATPDGDLRQYDKRHLFRMADEHHHYTAGSTRCVFRHNGWRLLTQVCYDLRFPVFSRLQGDYDAIVYVANWPARRRHHWRQLLIARAIENQSYVIGINRVGIDGNGVDYSGDSLIVDPLGEVVFDAGRRAGLFAVTLDLEVVRGWREKFPAWMDADDFRLL